jgi:hypothetical protein
VSDKENDGDGAPAPRADAKRKPGRDSISVGDVSGDGTVIGKDVTIDKSVKLHVDTMIVGSDTVGGDSQASDPKVRELLKRSTLLQTQAAALLQEAFEANKEKVLAEVRAKGIIGARTLDATLAILRKYADQSVLDAKFKEALELIQQVEALDPSNVDALIQHSQVLGFLKPDDASARKKPLYLAQGFLSLPKNDAERLQLAQVMYMLAMLSDPIDLTSLNEARSIFDALGRKEYVESIDALVAQVNAGSGSAGSNAQGNPQSAFQPAGRWMMQMNDGKSFSLLLDAGGFFQGTMLAMGMRHALSGGWAFDSYSGVVRFQGLVDGYTPFVSAVRVEGQRDDGYFGVDGAGIGFFLTKT